MSESVDKYSLDATDYYRAVDRIVQKNRELASSLIDLGTDVANNAKQLDAHSKVIEKASNLPAELIAAYKLLGGEFDDTGTKIVFLNERLQEHRDQLKDVTTAYDTAFARQADIVLKAEQQKQRAIAETDRIMTATMQGRSGQASFFRQPIGGIADNDLEIQTRKEVQTLAKAARDKQKIREQEIKDLSRSMLEQSRILEQQAAQEKELRIATARRTAIADRVAAQFRPPPDSPPPTTRGGGSFDTSGPRREVALLTEEMDRAEKVGRRSADGILLSWKSMARLFVIQAAHTAVREFIQAIEESISAAAQWQIKISEIRTITQDQPRTFDAWASSVRRLSDEFGNPILDVTEGLYETISNQVGKGATAVNFMTKALQFARVTGSSTADSVNLLSSVLNSFSLSTVETDRVASVLFKTIDKGRLRAEDIANTFGRVGPSAHALGLSIEEVGAALATLTIKGVPPEEALTLLNNVMKGLISPTKDMKQFLHGLGVETGEQAIQIKSFAGVLADLEKQARGSSSEIGNLFRDVRGRRGATIFSGEGLNEFQQNLDAMQRSAEDFQKAIGISMESPGAQLLKQLNQVKNFFIDDFARPIISDILSIANALSSNGLVGILQQTIAVGKVALATYVAYRVALSLGNKEGAISSALAVEQAANDARLVSIGQARIAQLGIQLELDTAISNIEKSIIANAVELTATYQAEAAALTELNAATATYIAETTAQTATTSRLVGVTTGVGTGLAGFLGSATVGITAFLGVLYFAYSKNKEYQERLEGASKAAFEIAAANNQKLTDSTAQELSKQYDLYTANLNARFSAYTDYAAKVQRKADEFTEHEIELAKQSADASKESINEYLKTYTEALSKLQSEHDKIIENIRKTEQDLDRSRDTFAENEFKRALKLAEHSERMKNPGARGNPVSGEQIALTQQEIDRLRRENSGLLTPSGNARTDAENATRALENVKRVDDLLTNQADRRFQIEEGRKRVAEQIAEIEVQRSAKESERQTENEKADIRAQQRANARLHQRPDAVKFSLDDQAASKARDLEAERRAEQDRITDKKLEELRITLQNYDASLANLPKINEIQQQGVNLQKEENALLEHRRDLLKQAADLVQSQIDAQKSSFTGLKVSLEEVQRFKLDPKLDIKDPRAIDAQFAQFDALVAKAQAAGLQDQKVIQDLAKERIDLENEVLAKIADMRAKDTENQIAEHKKLLNSQIEQQKTALIELQQQSGNAAAQLFSLIGTPSDKGVAKGPIEELFNVEPGQGGDIEKHLEDLRRLTTEITKEQAKAVETGTLFNPKRLDELVAKYKKLKDSLNLGNSPGARNPDATVGPERFNAAGESIGKMTITEALTQGSRAIEVLRQIGEQINARATERLKSEQDLKATQKRQDSLSGKIDAQAKSFDDLNKETLMLLDSMQKLNAWLDQQRANPVPGGVPLAPLKLAFGGAIGTDNTLAMLTPGEFVVNKSATSKFLPQLMSMNRYEDGGLVNWNPNFARPQFDVPLGATSSLGGVTIGSITIQGGVSPEYDARTLGRSIEREVRLGRLTQSRSDA